MEHHESDTSRLKRWGQRQRRTNSKCTIYIYICVWLSRHKIHWTHSDRRALTTFLFPCFYHVSRSSPFDSQNTRHTREEVTERATAHKQHHRSSCQGAPFRRHYRRAYPVVLHRLGAKMAIEVTALASSSPGSVEQPLFPRILPRIDYILLIFLSLLRFPLANLFTFTLFLTFLFIRHTHTHLHTLTARGTTE